MERFKVAIVGGGHGGYSIYRTLRQGEYADIIGIADINSTAPGILAAHEDGVYNTLNFEDLVSKSNIDVIIEATGIPWVQNKIHLIKEPRTAVMEAHAADLMMIILQEKEKLLGIKKIKGELSAILNSVQEAIEVADNNGVIKYVNPGFTRLTGISEENRIGRNILKESPNGALAQAIRGKKPIVGHRTQVGGTNVEVISNASPIVVDGKVEGAVVVFQHLTDIMKLMEEYQKSTKIIKNLYDQLGQITSSKYTFNNLIGNNREFKNTIAIANKASESNSTVLLMGESGTGKEIFAHAIHHASKRREKPFIKVNCAAIPETLLESEFFGYEKGAFTGAVKSKSGKFELANGGTIFLDEIGDMNLFLQAKLLRVIQEMEFEKIGGTQTIKVDVRVIAATNRDLKDMIRKGLFREDFYYRLNVMELNIPPLRKRKEDIPALINYLIVNFNRKLGKKIKGLSPDVEESMYSYDWPGNVRELENVLERAMVTADDDIIHSKDLLHYIDHRENQGELSDLLPLEEMEKAMIKRALDTFGNTLEGKRASAKILKISLATLYNKLKKYKFS